MKFYWLQIILLGAFVWIMVLDRAPACDACYHVPITQQSLQDPRQGIFAGINGQYIHNGALQGPHGELPNEGGQYLDTTVVQTVLGWQIGPRFGLLVHVPYVYRSWRRAAEGGGGMQAGRIDGLGDLSVMADIGILENHTHGKGKPCFGWHGQAGIKLPTGDASFLRDAHSHDDEPAPGELPHAIHGHDLALGSGSVDLLIGTSGHMEWNEWIATALLQYAVRTKGRFEYQYGNDLSWMLAFGRRLVAQPDWNLTLRLTASGTIKDKDKANGEKMNDTGMTVFFMGPQVALQAFGRMTADFGIDLPVATETTGIHAVADYRLRMMVNWQF